MCNENYEEDLEELFCNDCKKSLGWNLPEISGVYAVCHSCYYLNGGEIRDMKERNKRLSKIEEVDE